MAGWEDAAPDLPEIPEGLGELLDDRALSAMMAEALKKRLRAVLYCPCNGLAKIRNPDLALLARVGLRDIGQTRRRRRWSKGHKSLDNGGAQQ